MKDGRLRTDTRCVKLGCTVACPAVCPLCAYSATLTPSFGTPLATRIDNKEIAT
jgi:hypothetical protein